MEGKNENQKTSQTACVVLALIAAGEKDHPLVKRGLQFLLDDLDNCISPPQNQEEEVVTIPFQSFRSKKRPISQEKQPRLRIFRPESEEKSSAYQFSSQPKLRIFAES